MRIPIAGRNRYNQKVLPESSRARPTMQQVLFHLPFTASFFPPEGVPLYGFGAMLFLVFVITAMLWGPRRITAIGIPKEKIQDLAIVLFLTGIAGARLVYMWQYYDQFPDKTFWGLAKAFVQIWNGGIVFYGSVVGGLLGYLVFYRLVLRKFGISTARLADALAPLLAIGLAVGRIGCYLNGCCWGQVACPECQVVPLPASLGEFPLLPAHSRDQVVRPAQATDRLPQIRGLQTSTGFTLKPRVMVGRESPLEAPADPRSVVAAVEPGSAAAKAGLQADDAILEVNGEPNRIVLEISGQPEAVAAALQRAKDAGGTGIGDSDNPVGVTTRATFDDLEKYRAAVAALRDKSVVLTAHDWLWELARDWPRGRKALTLKVQRGSETPTVEFTPKTVTFYPTQLYETISMVLITLLLVAFQPFRRHNGQVMVLLMLTYGVHRFLNEAIRIEPTYSYGLTLSQWISVAIVAAGSLLELFLRATQAKLAAGPQPLGGPAPVGG